MFIFRSFLNGATFFYCHPMKRSILFLFSLVALFACKKEQPKPSDSQMPEFPFVKVEHESIYITTFNGTVVDTASTFKVTSEANDRYQIVLQAAGITQPSTLFTDGTWLYEYGINGTELNATKVYKRNATLGESWEEVADGDTIIGVFKAIDTEVSVAAGNFVVDKVATVEKGTSDTSYIYISPQAGIVLQEQQVPGFSLRLELYEKNF